MNTGIIGVIWLLGLTNLQVGPPQYDHSEGVVYYKVVSEYHKAPPMPNEEIDNSSDPEGGASRTIPLSLGFRV